ncbi:MAG: MMPL family transporter [Gaiellales bacterium]
MQTLARIVAGRRSKWLVLAAWVAVAAAFGPLQAQLNSVTQNDSTTFLPADADSTKALEELRSRFDDGRTVPALIVYQNPAGLTDADRAAIAADEAAIAQLPDLAPIQSPLAPQAAQIGLLSEDGTTAIMLVPVTAQVIEDIEPAVNEMRDIVKADAPDGLEVYVSGPAGITVDAVEVFGSIDGTLLIGTTVLILVLLLLIYRSPIIAVVPLVVVGIAYAVAGGVVYLVVKAFDLPINGQATGILIILMFGAGTDYCIYLVARFREELRVREDTHEAMQHAVARSGPAILSCGGTVVAAMLVLLFADLSSTRNQGPVLAIGILITMIAGLTLLPALLTIVGRRSFWPAVPRFGSADRSRRSVYHRVGEIVTGRPIATVVIVTMLLAVCVLGILTQPSGLGIGGGFRAKPESIQGQIALSKALPPGELATTQVIVDAPADRLEAATGAVIGALQADTDDVASVRPSLAAKAGDAQLLEVVLTRDPYSDAAAASIPRIRQIVDAAAAGAGATALVGGPTAQDYDTDRTISRDAKVIVPLTLLLILLILGLLLRAVVAPLYLIATVILSYFATLGLTYVIFIHVFGSPGVDPGYATFLFLFAVALGVDYNIFLVSRIREEAESAPMRPAVLRALETTGGVITSAGLILAGTFLVLMTLPLEALFQLGFGVALGVLIDTFVVRTLLVPALAVWVGDRSWWPGRVPSHTAPPPAD